MLISSTLEVSAASLQLVSWGTTGCKITAQGGAASSMVFECSKNSSHKPCILTGDISAHAPFTRTPFTAPTQVNLGVSKYNF